MRARRYEISDTPQIVFSATELRHEEVLIRVNGAIRATVWLGGPEVEPGEGFPLYPSDGVVVFDLPTNEHLYAVTGDTGPSPVEVFVMEPLRDS